MEGAYPILKDEYAGEIKLKVAMLWSSGCGDWEDIWFSKYLKDKYEYPVVCKEDFHELFPNSYAPANAEGEVKKKAKEIIPSNNDDGVGIKINELLFYKE